jgi:hypothetical protein
MTEHHVTELLERATADLGFDPDLVNAGIAAGRRRRRRHLVGTAVATVAVLGLAGTGLVLAVSGDGPGGTRAVDPAAQTTPTRPKSQAPVATEHWQLAVTAGQVPATFASVLPGGITELPQKEPDIPIVDFQWNGFATRVGLVSDSFITGRSIPDPRQRCEEFGSGGQPCTPGRVPGSFEQSMTWTGPPVDGGVTTRLLTVYFAEGWDVTVTVSNAADSKNSPVLAPDVPLTLDQLREVAYSDAWFR